MLGVVVATVAIGFVVVGLVELVLTVAWVEAVEPETVVAPGNVVTGLGSV